MRREMETVWGSGDVGPALQLVSEHLQTDYQGPSKYQVLSERQCSEANGQ